MSQVDIDLRGFTYTLDPLARKHAWQLDALQLELTRAEQALQAAQDELSQHQTQYQEQVQYSLQLMQRGVDPAKHYAALTYLVQLRARIETSEAACLACQQEQERLQKARLVEHQRLECLKQHREETLHNYIKEANQRLSQEADRDWLARRLWRKIHAAN